RPPPGNPAAGPAGTNRAARGGGGVIPAGETRAPAQPAWCRKGPSSGGQPPPASGYRPPSCSLGQLRGGESGAGPCSPPAPGQRRARSGRAPRGERVSLRRRHPGGPCRCAALSQRVHAAGQAHPKQRKLPFRSKT
ncbi:PREDICTED: translation initiation factor IF-2-like, partial [Chinchilla lanigera]|uniref:translation initiation factor IF-2-like n=1 Tax=Chinchilla lanigera TaxID=34839 RepID=UPI0006967DB4